MYHGVGCSVLQIGNTDRAYIDLIHDVTGGEHIVESSNLNIMRTNTEENEEYGWQLVPAPGTNSTGTRPFLMVYSPGLWICEHDYWEDFAGLNDLLWIVTA